MNPTDRLMNRSPGFWVVVASVLLVTVGVLDAVTGNDLAFSVFYLIPIALLTWFAGRNAGLAACVAAAALWLVADILGDTAQTTHIAVRLWNTTVRFGIFAAVALLLPAVQALRREQELARVDPLTGAANRRRLCEAVHLELLRSQRYVRPMTVAFFDLDGFKQVNDQLGHAAGDRVLCTVVQRIQGMVRQTDLLARVGGDEFVLLLPEIDQGAAHVLIPKLHRALHDEMRRMHWPVTFSIGVMTWRKGAVTAEELIARADTLMYDIKHSGKNAVAYAVYGSPEVDRRPVPAVDSDIDNGPGTLRTMNT